MRRVIAITFLNFFVSGALTLLIPLLLLSQNVNLAEIGIVLSALPLVFLIARLVFAAVADCVGWSHIFLLVNWPATFFSTVIYYFASSLPVFLAGKLVEGFRESSFWAVSRTAIFHLSPKRKGNEATRNYGVTWLATAAGAAISGVSIAGLGFSLTLAVLVMVSSLVGVPALLLWRSSSKTPVPKTECPFRSLDPRGRSKTFWLVSLALMFNGLAIYPLITLLFPTFMNQQLGYDYISIGVVFMSYNALSALAAFLSLRSPLSLERAIILSATSVIASFFLADSGLLFPVLVMVLALARGYGIGFFEFAVVSAAKDSRNVSADIGLLHTPLRLAEFSSILAAGFVVQSVGYAPMFVATGIFFGVFAFLCFSTLRD